MSELLVSEEVSQAQTERLFYGDELGLIGCEGLTYSELFGRYANSTFGQYQADQPARYSNGFAYDRGTMILDLGDDVHPLRHMTYTESQILRPLMTRQNNANGDQEQFSDQEIVAGRLGALLHDIGECEHNELKEICGGTVGDVNFWLKTAENEGMEAAIRRYFYATLYNDVPGEILEMAEDMIANNSGSLLRDGFATAERIGYLTTGITAGLRAIELGETAASEQELDRFSKLAQLGLEVTSHWYDEVRFRGERFPYARDVTDKLAPAYNQIHTIL